MTLFMDFETNGLAYGADVFGLAVYDDNPQSFWTDPMWWPIEDPKQFKEELQHFVDSHRGSIVFHNAAFDLVHMDLLGVKLPMDRVHCTQIMSYVLYPLRPEGHSLAAWGERLGQPKGEFDHEAFMHDPRTRLQKARDPVLKEYALQDIRVTKLLWNKLTPEMAEVCKRKPEFRKLYFMELEYMRFLIKCRHQGYQLDLEKLPVVTSQIGTMLYNSLDVLNGMYPLVPGYGEEKLYKGGGYRRQEVNALGEKHWKWTHDHCKLTYTNWNSTHHKLRLLDRTGWEASKKTEKGADCCDAESLEPYKDEDSPRGELCSAILTNQELTKLYNTYLVNFTEMATEDGTLRGNFNQCITKTGRLSSSEPNLTNIPSAGEYGKLTRSLFIATPGRVFCSVDLDQIEFRVMASRVAEDTGDTKLLQPFLDGEDVHEYNRLKWGIATRLETKTVTYSVLFGGGPLVVGRGDYKAGKKLLDKFNEANPAVNVWKKRIVEKAKRDGGELFSPFGRRFLMPGLFSKDTDVVARAERSVVSCAIQGTAADIFKLLTNNLTPVVEQFDIYIHGPIHDELTMSLRREDSEQAMDAVVKTLASPAGGLLLCPVASKGQLGANWAECH
jgi:DNA polymerase I-like protein with 3'-5' exonuclease and polymerase domains